MGALFLASKLEEAPLRIRDIVNCFSYLDALVAYCSSPPYPPASTFEAYAPMDYFATEFYDRKDAMVIAEMQILKRLAFQTQCGLPYGHLVNYLQVLELAGENDLVRRCWGFCNDLFVILSLALAVSLETSWRGLSLMRAHPPTTGCKQRHPRSTRKARWRSRPSTSRRASRRLRSPSRSSPCPGGPTSTRPRTRSSTSQRCCCGCIGSGGATRGTRAPRTRGSRGTACGRGRGGYRSRRRG